MIASAIPARRVAAGWPAPGPPFGRARALAARGHGFRPFQLLGATAVSPDAKILRFATPSAAEPLGGAGGGSAPTGVKVLLPGSTLNKSYSPVSHPAAPGHFDLLVRAYPPREGGGVGAYLCGLREGERAMMRVKPPNFSLLAGGALTRNRWRHLGLVACGTGLAPLVQVSRQVLDDPDDTTQVSLVFTNRTEADILMRSELEEMAKSHGDRFRVFHTLTRPGGQWAGGRGRPDAEMLREHLPPPGDDTMILVCGTDGLVETVAGEIQRVPGPNGMTEKVQGPVRGLLGALGYSQGMVHRC